MKKLILIRHAQAGVSNGRDIERGLTSKGEKQAETLGRQLNTQQFKIDCLFCSDATRAIQTATLLRLCQPKLIVQESGLYLAYSEELINFIRTLDDSFSEVGIVGHNPGISELAWRFMPEMAQSFKTCQALVLEFAVEEWQQVGADSVANYAFYRG